jgi:hypothetical protein
MHFPSATAFPDCFVAREVGVSATTHLRVEHSQVVVDESNELPGEDVITLALNLRNLRNLCSFFWVEQR